MDILKQHMGHNIDADKLIAEIERRKDVHRKNYEESKDERFINDECEDDRILSLIASLQQEQPDFPTTDEQIKEFLATHPEIKVPEKYENPDWLFKMQERPLFPPIGYAETYYQKGLHDGIIKGQIEILKGLEEIEKRKAEPVLVIKEQDKPEVDYNKFEKLFCDFCERNKGHHITSHDACMWFWELGLKARKED